MTGSGSVSLTIAGTLTQVNAALATLQDTDATTPTDTITLNATDGFGNTAAQKTIAVTVNARPAFSAPASAVIGVNKQTTISSISLTENGNTTGETAVVTVSDTHGLLTVGNASGVTLGGNDSDSLTISGAFASVQSALSTLLDTDATAGSDTITLNATDGFGNTANTDTVGVTVNGLPVIAAPSTLDLGVGKAGSITGVSLSETGTTTNETFMVTLTDMHGVLSASNAGGASVSNAGTTLTIGGSLTQVNAALDTLSDTDGTTSPDTITLNALDSFGNSAAAKSIAVAVANGPVLAAPTAATVGVNRSSPISGVSVSETGATTSETFTVTLTDTNGLLTATASGAAVLGGNDTHGLSVSGDLTDVNNTLATLHDTGSSLASDAITVNATDGFGNTAGATTTDVTVNGLPSILAPSTKVIGVTHITSIAGVSVNETGVTTNEALSVTVKDTTGDLSASIAGGASVTGGGTESMLISGTFTQVNAALATLTDQETSAGTDAIVLNATDGFGNVASSTTIGLTVNGLPVITAPSAVTVGIAKPLTIAGVSLAESGTTTGEAFSVTLTDTHGVLSASAPQGGSVSAGVLSLTIAGSLTQVNAALATLSDTDSTLTPDTVTLNATDSLGNMAAAESIPVSVANGPVIAVPSPAVIGVGKLANISGISVSESGGTTIRNLRGDRFRQQRPADHQQLRAAPALPTAAPPA